ncbi:MFS transporter [Peristeroidobacter soli]|uniref:MFS transporter n=1 Tax=Peristeroidobacter soli TaxID=2497877 RepID=UPI00101CFA9B|nr:MFS transporter [Peristeroidobacter soli]
MTPDRNELSSIKTKVVYGLGSVAFGIKDNGFNIILLLFYNQVIGLPAYLVSGAIAMVLVVEGILDPIIGQVSDNFRSRWGRRHPFMYASALPVALSYLMLWNPPEMSQSATLAYLVCVALVVRTFISFYEIPSAALVPELTDDYDKRTSFLAFRSCFAWYGGLTMSFLSFRVFLVPDAEHPVGQLNEAGYHLYGMTAAAIMFVVIMVSALGTHKFIPLFRQPVKRELTLKQYGDELLTTLKNRSFLIVMASSMLAYISMGLTHGLWVYFMSYFWELSNVGMSMMTLSWFVAVFAAFFLAPRVSHWIGKRNGVMVLYPLGFAITTLPLVLRLVGLFPDNGSDAMLPLLLIFTGAGAILTSASWILTPSMLADVVEESELKTGRRSEGVFFAGSAFLQKSMSGMGVFVSGLILTLVGFPQGAKPGLVDPEVLRNLTLVFVILVSLLHLGAVLIIRSYKITRASHAENVRRLAARAALTGGRNAAAGDENAPAAAPANTRVEPT